MAREVHARHARLVLLPQYAARCPCGRRKTSTLPLAKVDASPFFKDASPARGLRRAKRFLQRLVDRTGFTAVAVRRAPRASGYLCHASRPSDADFAAVSFEDILHSMLWAAGDDCFLLGSSVVRRVSDWPMGGSLSEPAPMVDPGGRTRMLSQDEATAWASG